jgi:hypothetical protein
MAEVKALVESAKVAKSVLGKTEFCGSEEVAKIQDQKNQRWYMVCALIYKLAKLGALVYLGSVGISEVAANLLKVFL